jgi:FHA domain
MGQPARAPLPQRSRKRWAVAAGVAVLWVVLLAVTGSAVTATVLLIVIAGLGVAGVLGLRALGGTRDHPRIPQMADRPWHDEQEPGYEFADSGPEFMHPSPQPARAGLQAAYAGPAARHDGPPYWDPYPDSGADDGSARAELGRTVVVNGMPTVMEQIRRPIPMLRLVTGDSVTETRMPGARAGRGAVELALPEVPTVSREHARFTFSDGQWWIANLGMNGLTINGSPVEGEHPLSDGDSIRWGMRPDALLSRVEIG